MQDESTKRCTGCGETKPLDAFTPDRNAPTGRVARCRPCRALAQRERYHREGEIERAKKRAYVAANAEAYRTRKREAQREWRQRNPELARERAREDSRHFRATNPAYHRDWYAANADIECERKREWNHRRRALTTPTSPNLAALMTAMLDESCVYCGATENMSIDHVVPLARGGKHEADNLVPACRTCNSSKNAQLLSEWAGPPHLISPLTIRSSTWPS